MAARLRKTHRDWKFYVYEVLDDCGNPIYVGKGSGRRSAISKKARGGSSVVEVARFFDERDAYTYEVERIASGTGLLNIAKGGNGGLAQKVKAVKRNKTKDERLIDRIGTRAFAARMVLGYYNAFKYISSRVEDARNALYSQEIISILESVDVAKMHEVSYGNR